MSEYGLSWRLRVFTQVMLGYASGYAPRPFSVLSAFTAKQTTMVDYREKLLVYWKKAKSTLEQTEKYWEINRWLEGKGM